MNSTMGTLLTFVIYLFATMPLAMGTTKRRSKKTSNSSNMQNRTLRYRTRGVPSCPDELMSSFPITPTLTFYYAIVLSPQDPSKNILCARLESEHEGWLGFGISPDGKMIGSQAIIGRPDDGTVKKYDMAVKSSVLMKPLPWKRQTLMDESILQENGRTIMSFTKLLEEDADIPILAEGKNIFLYAEASGSDFKYHGTRKGWFSLDFSYSYAY